MRKLSLDRVRLLVCVLALLVCGRDAARAEPSEPMALAAAQAFLADPEKEFKGKEYKDQQVSDLPRVAAAAKASAFGEAKIVFSDGSVAIAATEFYAPELTQTFYIRLRLNRGRWAVVDWLDFRSLGINAQIVGASEKLTQPEWDKKRADIGGAVAAMDFETMKERTRVMYGSDETIIEALQPVLADLTTLCRRVANTEAVNPVGIIVAKADVSTMTPEVAAIVDDAGKLGVIMFVRIDDGGVLGLAGMLPDGGRLPSLGRYLMCTPDEKTLSLPGQLAEHQVNGIRDLGNGVYFLRH